jgi:creatinine amidohydrolase/Fe(II)-dependent formamide hydrolase-like protein
MNTHIELVKKWLADPESVTQQELEDNRDAANSAYAAADYAVYGADFAGAANAANAAKAAVYAAKAVDYWVKRYEELTEQGE